MKFVLSVIALAAFMHAPAIAQSTQSDPIASQKGLEVISGFPFPASPTRPGAPFIPKGKFAEWSDQQKLHVLPSVMQACMMMWVMGHDAPDTRFLPKTMSDADESELGLDLCLAGHMPEDWPEQKLRVRAAADILDRAAQLGSSYHLPSSLKR